MTDKEKRPQGRPRIPEHLKKKNTTRTMRVPNDVIDDLKALVRALNDGLVSIEEIRELAKKGA